MARIYVSSTFQDLEDFRKAVNDSLHRLGHEDVAMEFYVAGDERPLDRCLSDVASCDVYVGIFAFRYGHVPQESNPEGRSITELEYRKALEAGRPCLIFLLSEEAPWPRAKQDRGAALDQIESLRHELSTRHVVGFFENADELTRKVNEAVTKWEKESGLRGKRQLTDWNVYREAVSDKHRWVRMQVIAGASRDRGIAKIPLTEVFEPQYAAAGVSRTDVPEEVLEYQRIIYGPRSEAADAVGPAEDQEQGATGGAVDPDAEEPLLSPNSELVLDLLGRESAQVVLGGPGSGKSTVLHHAMLRLCKAGPAPDRLPVHLRDAPIPFLIELRNYVLQKAPDFVSYIVQNSRTYYDATVEAESVVNALENEGKALVLFDGLDEVFDPDERRRVIDQFQTFARRYPQTRIVVTSRIAGYDRTALGLAGFQHYTLLPLALGQIRHFAGQWYEYYTLDGTERTAQGLVQRIVESPRLLDLAGNPLLLTMMAVVYKDRDLPNERWRLYQRCAETLLEDWELGKGIEVEDFKLAVHIRAAQKSEILQRVSMHMLRPRRRPNQPNSELNAIAYAPLLDIVAGYLQEKYQRSRGDAEAIAVDVLRHLMEHTYVLAEIGERVFGFVHRTFMEYFAACRCQAEFNARKSDFDWLTRDVFGGHWLESEWEEVLLLLIAMLHDQGTPIRDVVECVRRDSKPLLPYNVAFAARCLGEAGSVQDADHGEGLLADLSRAIAENAAHSRNEEVRTFVETALKAFAALAPLAPASAEVQTEIDRLNQAGNVASRMAAWRMGFALRSHDERLDYALAALQDKEETVRRGAVAALESEWPGRADLGSTLADVVRNDPRIRVRQTALTALQRSWRQEPAVLEAIASRIDKETAYTSVIRLIEYLTTTWRGNYEALGLVVRLAGRKPKARSDHDHAKVTQAAARGIALGWGGDPQAFAFLQDRATDDPDPLGRVAVLQAIMEGWSADQKASAFFHDRLINDPEPKTRAAVLQAIAWERRGDAQAMVVLQDRAANDPNPETRAAVLQAIATEWRRDARALAFLQGRAADDPDPQTRAVVLRVIAQGWGGEQALAFLQGRAVDDPDPQTRAIVLQALAKGGATAMGWWGDDSQVLPFLQDRGISDPDPRTRGLALRAIVEGWGSQPHVLAFLEDRAINDPDPETRTATLRTISECIRGNAAVVAFLRDRATNDPEASVRDALRRLLDGSDRRLRVA